MAIAGPDPGCAPLPLETGDGWRLTLAGDEPHRRALLAPPEEGGGSLPAPVAALEHVRAAGFSPSRRLLALAEARALHLFFQS